MTSTDERVGAPLSVLFDGYWLLDGPPSGRNVVGSLIAAWSAQYPDDRLTVALPSSPPASLESHHGFDAGIGFVEIPPRVRNHGLWVTGRIGRIAAPYDVVITQNFTPWRGTFASTKRVTFVHDALFVDHPNWFTLPELAYFSGIGVGTRNADLVLTSSRSEQRRIQHAWPRLRERVEAVGLGVPTALALAVSRRPTALPEAERPYILAVGRLNYRKNLRALIAAYSSSPRLSSSYDLVIVGAADGKDPGLDGVEVPGSVRFLGHVTDGELAWLYRHCELFAFPSLGEGFGLPLLEAAYFSARTIASDIGVFREIGVAESYFDPHSIESIGAALERALATGASSPRHPEPSTGWESVAVRTRRAVHQALKGEAR
ncbi:glycosyltransferase family 1 protein [Agromyces sp. Marseille-P2726]|uniref:glycosyltransferase family 4 protein n=1 Tax=Agromyces sp. Marseille-P2726 TaxID=2709132 RepID=UPI00156D85DA|nr:glycosyltransferase family 1 protein [Agromyces sp. Marseille-P2726]